ncbi:unnamed protein product, partial [Scytosiphon promiscuus]
FVWLLACGTALHRFRFVPGSVLKGIMFGSSGGDGGYGVQQHGYQTRSRGRSRHEAQEERLVEGDLFGSTKRQSFRSAEPPTGLPPRASYYDGTSNVGGNAFANAAGAGAGGGPVGYGQTPRVAQPSPFARGRTPTNSYAAPTPTNAFFSTDGGVGTAPRSGYGGPRYSQVSPATGPRPQQEQDPQGFSAGVGSASEVALVPVESSGSGRGRATWVVVWGVPLGKGNEVLTRFLNFGDVEEQRGHPGSNWLYLKYATRLQAEKALAAGHGSRLTDTVMLGVQRVPDDEVVFFFWQDVA